jgi:exodeoxyribonuclease V alpha subunit
VTDLALTVRKVWPGASGGAVFTGQDEAGTLHRVVADGTVLHRAPLVGERWDVAGPTQVHPRFGPQVHAQRAVPLHAKGEHLRRFLARNKVFQGVGEARTRCLWDAFGEGLHDLLDAGDAPRLASVLGPDLAASLVDTWKGFQGEARVIRWLEDHHFPLALATKALRMWGADAADRLAENPYRMLAVAGWSRVDAAALDAKADPDCPERRIAAVEAVCYRALGDKHTAIPEVNLLAGVRGLLRCPPETAREALVLAEADRAVVRLADGLWQPFGPWTMETFVRDRIQERVDAEFAPSGNLFWSRPGDGQVSHLVAEFEAQEGLPLVDEQRHAIWLAAIQRFALVMGGAGTGKTTLLKAVRHVQEAAGGSILGVALAGRAAQRLREAGCPARTLAGLLGALERQELPLGGGDLIVVDEASMLDLPLAYTLLRRLPPETRVLLVGDPHQLPPIGFGLVFGALVGDRSVPQVELTRIHRAAEVTGIPGISRAIRKGSLPHLPAFNGAVPGVSFLPCRPEDAQAVVIETLGALGGDAQVLSPIKRGPAGTLGINAALHALRSTGKPVWSGLALGDPVIHLENDYEALVFNGTLGVVVEVLPDGIQVQWDGHDRPMDFREDRRYALDLAYAISVHKAQGSQFRRVVIPVFPNRLLDRTLVYTALTRAQEQVVLVGDRDAMEAAVTAPPAPNRRRTGMGVGAW